jgi:TRAP-type C4-dicarboxylate transport system substrate-binding protein
LLKGKIESDVDDVKRIPERLKESASKAAADVKEAATKKVEATTARIKEAPKLVVETTKAAATRATTEVKDVVTKKVDEAKDAVVEAVDVVASFPGRKIQEVSDLPVL